MKVLVTGGAGFIGSFLVDELVERGHDVAIFDSLDQQVHPGGKPPDYLNPRAALIQGDVRDYEALKRAVLDAEAVYHQAAAVGVGQSQYDIKRYVDVNIGGTANLLDILANNRHRVRKIVVAGSMSAYGEGLYMCASCGQVRPETRTRADLDAGRWEPVCPSCGGEVTPVGIPESGRLFATSIYAITKRVQEDMTLCFAESYHVPATVLRYFNAYGPRQSLSNPYTGVAAIFISRIRNGRRPIVYEDGAQKRDFISVHDIVRANLAALERDTGAASVFNVGTGRPTGIEELARLLAEGLGAPTELDIPGKWRAGDIRHCWADMTLTRQALGFEAQVPLSEGLVELLEWGSRAEAANGFDQAARELESRGLA